MFIQCLIFYKIAFSCIRFVTVEKNCNQKSNMGFYGSMFDLSSLPLLLDHCMILN